MMYAGGWAAFALLGAAFSAAFYLLNQYQKLPGHMVILPMRLLIIVLLLPFLPWIDFPRDPVFYGAVATATVFGIGADVRLVNVASAYGGGVTSRLLPMMVWGTFLLWLPVRPDSLQDYAAAPLRTAGIVAALLACVWFSTRLQKCAVSKAAMKALFPAVAAYAVVGVFNKVAMDHGADAAGDIMGGAYAYMLCQSVLAVLILAPYAFWRERAARESLRRAVTTLPLWRAAFFLSLVWLGHMLAKNYAVFYTANPAYQAAINLTAAVFVSLWYALRGQRETTDVASGMGVVASAAALVLLTAG